jgi:uncharacterized protein YndB with AHSA1/START domain
MADILHEITIAAPAAPVFDAVTSERGLKGWWTDDVRADAKSGTVAEFGFFGHTTVFRMRIDALAPASEVRWTCIGGPEDWIGTTVDFALSPGEDGGTTLSFKHGGWRQASSHFARCSTTWGLLMHRLKGYAEGKGVRPYFVGPGVAE